MKSVTRFRELDALRGALALWVFAGHYLEIIGFRPEGAPSRIILATWMPVAVFMILSGFAITRSLMLEPTTYRDFLRARIARLYPAYLIGLALATLSIPAMLRVVGQLPDPVLRIEMSTIFESSAAYYGAHLLAHLLFVHEMIPEAMLSKAALAINPPMWSLSIEAQFYIVAPLIVMWLRKPVLWPVGLFFLAVSPALPWLPEYVGPFVLGIVTALYIDHLRETPAAAFHAGLAVIAAAALTRNIMVIFPAALWSAFILVSCMRSSPVSRRLSGLLSSRILQFCGDISYSLYIYHYPILILVLFAARNAGLEFGTARMTVILSAAFPIAIAVAAASFYAMERPIYRRFKSLPRRKLNNPVS
jgi:peptidoglycan/LPS O-acetylase OafA/YrhL